MLTNTTTFLFTENLLELQQPLGKKKQLGLGLTISRFAKSLKTMVSVSHE